MVFNFRKVYDALMDLSRKKANHLTDLRKDAKVLLTSRKLMQASHGDSFQRLKALEMQLNTVTIKIAETGENRRNYELNIAHLKEEDFEHFNQLEAMRKMCSDNNNFYKKMLGLKADAKKGVEGAEDELLEFKR
jgi:hypothetical protein